MNSTNLVLLNDGSNIVEVFLGEDEADVPFDVRKQLLEVGIAIQVAADGLPYGGVLAHQDGGFVAEGDTNLLHLFGAHIVRIHDEELGVLVEEGLRGREGGRTGREKGGVQVVS